MSRYLLVVACSQRKRADSELLPAIERYDGVNFRVIRKAKREGYWSENLDMLILSAKYGLLKPDVMIGNYDLQMTMKRASTLSPQVGAGLEECLAGTKYDEIFVNVGQVYMVTLSSCKGLATLDKRVHYATGGIGQKMSQMKAWLRQLSARQGGKSDELA
jgi:hypothetical protein